MTDISTTDLEMWKEKLVRAGQEHLLAFWDDLDERRRARLLDQLAAIDLDLVARLIAGEDTSPPWASGIDRVEPPTAVRRSSDEAAEKARREAHSAGEETLRKGEVGMILVAGGQGSRLGFSFPKGILPVGPLSGRTLFKILIDRLRAIRRRYGCAIPLYIMTSPATHDQTVNYFRDQRYLGLPPDDLVFFCQGQMPAVDAATGRILLADRDRICLSPDGHGGMLKAFSESGCLTSARERGIRRFFYGQVDNPLLQVCDPTFLGFHIRGASELTLQVVPKTTPHDKVGNVVKLDDALHIIEYSDLPDALAGKRNADGSLVFWAGSIAVHVFELEFLQRMVDQADALPFHRAHKKVPYIDQHGNRVTPAEPNAIKFERFIFDLLPSARNALAVEVDPADAFAPVKNAPGSPTETVATAQAAMMARDRRLLTQAGVVVDDDVTVEVNPCWAIDAEEVAHKTEPGTRIDKPTYFSEYDDCGQRLDR